MGKQYGGVDISMEAGEDMSSSQYYMVDVSAADKVDLVDAATDAPIGVLQNAPESGQAALVRITGHTKVVVGAPVSVNDKVMPDASGRAVTATPGSDTTKYIVGTVTKAADAAGEIAEIVLQLSGRAA